MIDFQRVVNHLCRNYINKKYIYGYMTILLHKISFSCKVSLKRAHFWIFVYEISLHVNF